MNESTSGVLARFVGPDATAAELWMQFTFAIAAAVALLVSSLLQDWSWSPAQVAVAAFLAFDIAGGIVTNATSAGKRWYHRPGRTRSQHFQFVALHGCHLGVVALAFYPAANQLALLGYAYLLASAALQLAAPVYLRRPIAALQTAVSILVALYVLEAPLHLEWLFPGLALKLLTSYLPYEKPLLPPPSTARG